MVEQSFKYLDWRHFVGAVIDAFQRLREAEDDGPATATLKADSDVWAWHASRRNALCDIVMVQWCLRSGRDETYFPYSRDAVARMFLRVRKRNDEEIAEWLKEVDG